MFRAGLFLSLCLSAGALASSLEPLASRLELRVGVNQAPVGLADVRGSDVIRSFEGRAYVPGPHDSGSHVPHHPLSARVRVESMRFDATAGAIVLARAPLLEDLEDSSDASGVEVSGMDASGMEVSSVTPEVSPAPGTPAPRSVRPGRLESAGAQRLAQAASSAPEQKSGCALGEPDARFDEVLELILKQHVDSGLTRDALYHAAIEGMLTRASLEQQGRMGASREPKSDGKLELPPSNRLLEPGERKNLERLREGTFLGVGLWLNPQPERGYLEVKRVMRGSPAAAAGLKAGDRILRVDQQAIGAPKEGGATGPRPMLASVAREQSGSRVQFTVLRGRDLVEVQLVRKEFPLEAVSAHLLPGGVGLVQLEYLSARAPGQVRQVLSQVQGRGASALILDLRASFGDDAQVARQLLELFVPVKTPVLVLEHRGQSRVALHALASPLSSLPLLILVDEQTVGVAEALAASLRELRSAKLIGGRTAGRATLETLVGLKDGHGVLISTATMHTPGGVSWEATGVMPDISVPVPAELDVMQLRDVPLAERLVRDSVLRVALGMLGQ